MTEGTLAGIFIDGERAPSKAALKRAVHEDARQVEIEDTEHFGLAPNLPATSPEEGDEIEVCGPDPYADREWSATLVKANGRVIVR
jgi:hypothetical protein